MWDMCAMLGIFKVMCCYCKTSSNSERGKWRCKMCGSNRGSYQTTEYRPAELRHVKKHWWSHKEMVIVVKESAFIVVTSEKTWESPPYKPKEEDKPKTPYQSAQSTQSVLHYETFRGVLQQTGGVQCTS